MAWPAVIAAISALRGMQGGGQQPIMLGGGDNLQVGQQQRGLDDLMPLINAGMGMYRNSVGSALQDAGTPQMGGYEVPTAMQQPSTPQTGGYMDNWWTRLFGY